MKVALLVLILANLAVFAWLRRAHAPAQADDLTPLTATGKRLALLPKTVTSSVASATVTKSAVVSAPATSTPASASVAQAGAGKAPVCLVWGPIADAKAAGGLAARLRACP